MRLFLCVMVLLAGLGCEEDRCAFGDTWCDENAVRRCDETYDCTVLHCTEKRQARETVDCGALGAFCQEFEEDSGPSVAFCSVTAHPCPTGIASLCVGEVLAVCHPTYNYPEWIVDCRETLGQRCVQQGPDATCE